MINNNTQLHRVFDLMKDGVWRTSEEVAGITGDNKHSVASRLRDLRLPSFGGHQVNIRRRNNTTWEYQVLIGISAFQSNNTQTNVSPNPANSTNDIVKFLNLGNMQVEYVAKDKCKILNTCGFNALLRLMIQEKY